MSEPARNHRLVVAAFDFDTIKCPRSSNHIMISHHMGWACVEEEQSSPQRHQAPADFSGDRPLVVVASTTYTKNHNNEILFDSDGALVCSGSLADQIPKCGPSGP
ncbi:hypothetical protein AVEN_233090-1 [Araneus ventricosus]|uniref:Uncharacterized protein n=1 Tax=Araneus ventricosus TaxID=182803 RepID=A0A4Y2DHU0_ARAVE|nr:hypothetical protein AVEN_233090-1 [Araneus ventricosus]